MDFSSVIEYYSRLLDRFPQIPPMLRRNTESRARSLDNRKTDSQESARNLSPSRSIDVYPFELDNGSTTHIIHAEQRYADRALEQPLLIPKPTPQIPHCFVIFHSNKKINPPQEQQLDEVLEQPHLRGKQQTHDQQPTTSKVRTYVSQPRNSGSIFIDRVNSFGDITDPPRSPDPQNSNNRQSRNSDYSSELGVEQELRIKRQRRAHLSAIPMPNFEQTTQSQPQLEREEVSAQEYVEQMSNEPQMTPPSQHDNDIEERLRALPEELQYASKERLVQELAAIQVEMKGLNCQQKPLNWHQRQASRRSQEFQTSQSEPLDTFGKAFTSTSKKPNFTNFWTEFQKFHQAMTRLLRSLNHQSKETQEALQALESWINSSDHLRSAETELLDHDIAIRTKLNLVDQTERVRISPTPQLDNLFTLDNEEPTPQTQHSNWIRPPPQLNFEESSTEPETIPDTTSVRIHRRTKTSRQPIQRSPDFASDQTPSVFRCIPNQKPTKTPKSHEKSETRLRPTTSKNRPPRIATPILAFCLVALR